MRVNFLHLLDQLGQDSEIGDLIDRRNLEVVENLVELRLWDLPTRWRVLETNRERRSPSTSVPPFAGADLECRAPLGPWRWIRGCYVENLTNFPAATLDPARYACIKRPFLLGSVSPLSQGATSVLTPRPCVRPPAKRGRQIRKLYWAALYSLTSTHISPKSWKVASQAKT